MKFYRHWAKESITVDHRGESWTIASFGASNKSPEDAQDQARQRARNAAKRITGGNSGDVYLYADRPLREEVLEEISVGEHLACVLTRNSYGSVVLNTPDVLFADIDLPPVSFMNRLRKLFGGSGQGSPEELARAQVQETAERNGLGVRLYRTRAGYRALVTNRLFEPGSAKALAVLEEFGSDPLYVKLCKVQQSFRARLSPKAWRCGAVKPPNRFPWLSADAEQQYRTWERTYNDSIRGYATCEFIAEYGSTRTDKRATKVVEIHDRYACNGGELA